MNHRYLDPLERLEFEIIERREQGLDFAELTRVHCMLAVRPPEEARAAAAQALDRLFRSDPRPQRPGEPDDLAAIRAAASARGEAEPARPLRLPALELEDRLLGGWLGRAAGCLLGKPVEGHPRPVLRELLEAAGRWPLSDYWTGAGLPAEVLARHPWKRRGGRESLRENLAGMTQDDDLDYTMLNLHVLEGSGPDFTSTQVAEAWLRCLPALQVFTGERVAYHNLLNGIPPPDSAYHQNPFREWIGAQIRADLWGYASPGCPAQAAEWAWRDASISHAGNGLYSAMFVAALVAGAFGENDPRRLVARALGEIPASSRLAGAVLDVLGLPLETMEWEAVLDELESRFGRYHWVHSINNTALVIAALVAGQGDFERTVCRVVMGGWDTDSNGATAGSIVGVMRGAAALPAAWTDPLGGRIRSGLASFDRIGFAELARRTGVVARHSAPPVVGLNFADDF